MIAPIRSLTFCDTNEDIPLEVLFTATILGSLRQPPVFNTTQCVVRIQASTHVPPRWAQGAVHIKHVQSYPHMIFSACIQSSVAVLPVNLLAWPTRRLLLANRCSARPSRLQGNSTQPVVPRSGRSAQSPSHPSDLSWPE